MRKLYIYYRIDAADEDAVLHKVHEFQARLTAQQPALHARLLIRADAKHAGQRTCMETYAVQASATDATLQTNGIDDDCQARIAAEASTLAPLLRSTRQTEIFTRQPSPARPRAPVEQASASADMPPTPFTLLLRVRYGECDAQQVVFNARYGEYADIAMSEYIRQLFGSYQRMLDAGIDTQVVRLTTDFRSPARFDDVVAISVETAAVGNTSFALTMVMREHATGRLLATTHATYVTVSARAHEKIRVPDDMRSALQRGANEVVVDQAGTSGSFGQSGDR